MLLSWANVLRLALNSSAYKFVLFTCLCVCVLKEDYWYDNKKNLTWTPMLDLLPLYRIDQNWKVSKLAVTWKSNKLVHMYLEIRWGGFVWTMPSQFLHSFLNSILYFFIYTQFLSNFFKLGYYHINLCHKQV